MREEFDDIEKDYRTRKVVGLSETQWDVSFDISLLILRYVSVLEIWSRYYVDVLAESNECNYSGGV